MLISLLILLLFSNALTLRKDQSVLYSRVVILGLSSIAFLSLNNIFIKPLEKGIGIYGGLFNVTTFGQSFNIFIFVISAIILTLTAFYPRKVYIQSHSSIIHLFFSKLSYNKNVISNKMGEQFKIIEYPLIILFILCGATFLISSADLISVFLSIELQSYGLYILSTLYRDSESATGSGLIYFLLGGLSSCFILLGSGFIYAHSGTSSLDNLYIINNLSLATLDEPQNIRLSYYIHLSLIIIFVGFLFKVSAAPFHFWSPTVYDGIPTIVTTFVAIVTKVSIFAFFLELVYYTEYNFTDFSWRYVLLVSSLLSLIVGSVLGLTQSRIKRLLAYSTISHVGFILLALSINSVESIQSYIFYIFQYTLSNLNAFIILVTMGYTLYLYVYNDKNSKKDKQVKEHLVDQNNSPIQLTSQIKGYFYVNPFIALSLSITLFSFVGIPPIIGFFGKQMVLSAALDNGYVFMALVAILTSVIGAGYYLDLIKQMFFFKQDYHKNPYISTINGNEGFFKNSFIDNSNLVGYIVPTNRHWYPFFWIGFSLFSILSPLLFNDDKYPQASIGPFEFVSIFSASSLLIGFVLSSHEKSSVKEFLDKNPWKSLGVLISMIIAFSTFIWYNSISEGSILYNLNYFLVGLALYILGKLPWITFSFLIRNRLPYMEQEQVEHLYSLYWFCWWSSTFISLYPFSVDGHSILGLVGYIRFVSVIPVPTLLVMWIFTSLDNSSIKKFLDKNPWESLGVVISMIIALSTFIWFFYISKSGIINGVGSILYHLDSSLVGFAYIIINILLTDVITKKTIRFETDNITVNSALSGTISVLTLLLLLFIFMPTQWFNLVSILTLILFKS